jgi:hypothetical protein
MSRSICDRMKHSFELGFVWGWGPIGDVVRAAEWLTDHWPADFCGTNTHVEAMQMCVLALEGEALDSDVRHMLVKAAREAGILALD